MRILALFIVLLLPCFATYLASQQIGPYDILITELMIDPVPSVGLPDFEWIELYNNTDETIDLGGLKYSSGTTKYTLPAYELAAGEFVMLCEKSNYDDLLLFGATIEIEGFPRLTNSGDVVRLETSDGTVIHEVIYQKSWYGDTGKDDGGYTLELINPSDLCLGEYNWAASASETGATPAAQNSMWAPAQPSDGVVLLSALADGSDLIVVSFDRIPDMAISVTDFSIVPAIDILSLEFDGSDARSVMLTLADDLQSGVVYSLTVGSTVADCLDNSSDMEQTIDFVLPQQISTGDIVINEVLFNPVDTAESDYIEIYNRSAKYLDINPLIIGNLDSDGSGSTRDVGISRILGPSEYLVFTEKQDLLRTRYTSAIADRLIELDLPSFNNDDGNVSLIVEQAGETIIVDAFNYTEEMHNAFIDDADGVALERVDFNAMTQDAQNWQSGASSTNYGTPTLPNSQGSSLSVLEENIRLEKKTFYPKEENDSQLKIIMDLQSSEYIGNIYVYDGSGRPVQQLANNQLIGRQDVYYWDGRDFDGILKGAGVYIIVVQLVNAKGNLMTKKLPCVLSIHL